MDCAGVASILVGYHFATLPDDERDAVDAHLLACQACLGAYLALKRASDKSALERPSPAVRERLRASVRREFPAPPRVAWLARRIPLYQGLCAAALAAAVALLVPTLVRNVRRAEIPEGAASLDSARPRAEALQIY